METVRSVEVTDFMDGLLTAEARFYSLRQLASRAGVSKEWFRSWRIEHGDDRTTVYPVADQTECRITFHHENQAHWKRVQQGHTPVKRLPRRNATRTDDQPDYVLPFVEREFLGPLFRVKGKEAECSADLLASVVLVLSRYEESLPGPRDLHGRFPAAASLAVQHDFADRPIVDELGFAFRDLLARLIPLWRPQSRTFRVNLTHDVDEIGIPGQFRKIAKHALKSGARTAVRDLVSLAGGRPAALTSVLDTVLIDVSHRLSCALFWKGSPASEFDSGYDITDPRVVDVIRLLQEAGIELGVHPGYTTFVNSRALDDEVNLVRNAVSASSPIGGRQHFLRWSPRMWMEWERCGLAYDSSVGFSERIGFRAGTCHPYRPWLFSKNREANLLEVPLIAMDCALTGPMGLRGNECIAVLLKAAQVCRNFGGVFTLLWHTDSILDPTYGSVYEQIVRSLAGQARFDWRTDRMLAVA